METELHLFLNDVLLDPPFYLRFWGKVHPLLKTDATNLQISLKFFTLGNKIDLLQQFKLPDSLEQKKFPNI